MDWHNEWIKSQRDLSAASKIDHYWRTMPRESRARMPADRVPAEKRRSLEAPASGGRRLSLDDPRATGAGRKGGGEHGTDLRLGRL